MKSPRDRNKKDKKTKKDKIGTSPVMSPREERSSPKPTADDTTVTQTLSTKTKKHQSVVYTDEDDQPVNEKEEQILKERDIWEKEEYDEFFGVAGIPGEYLFNFCAYEQVLLWIMPHLEITNNFSSKLQPCIPRSMRTGLWICPALIYFPLCVTSQVTSTSSSSSLYSFSLQLR